MDVVSTVCSLDVVGLGSTLLSIAVLTGSDHWVGPCLLRGRVLDTYQLFCSHIPNIDCVP